jgi:CHASE1-domain containing sensor protein
MFEAIFAAAISTYGVSGVLSLAVVYLFTRLIAQDRNLIRLEKELDKSREEAKERMEDQQKYLSKRAAKADAHNDNVDKKLDSIVNWAVSTGEGDPRWLQGD